MRPRLVVPSTFKPCPSAIAEIPANPYDLEIGNIHNSMLSGLEGEKEHGDLSASL